MAIAVLLHLYLQLLYGRQAAGSRQQAAGFLRLQNIPHRPVVWSLEQEKGNRSKWI